MIDDANRVSPNHLPLRSQDIWERADNRILLEYPRNLMVI